MSEYKGSKLSFFSYKLSDNAKLKSNLRLRVNNSGDDFETTFDHGYLGYSRSGFSKLKSTVNATAGKFYKYSESASEGGLIQALRTESFQIKFQLCWCGYF